VTDHDQGPGGASEPGLALYGGDELVERGPAHFLACARGRLGDDEQRLPVRRRELLGEPVLAPRGVCVDVKAVDVDDGAGEVGVVSRRAKHVNGSMLGLEARVVASEYLRHDCQSQEQLRHCDRLVHASSH
jgi:hypothetical protein